MKSEKKYLQRYILIQKNLSTTVLNLKQELNRKMIGSKYSSGNQIQP
jgi:hypothetical protein